MTAMAFYQPAVIIALPGLLLSLRSACWCRNHCIVLASATSRCRSSYGYSYSYRDAFRDRESAPPLPSPACFRIITNNFQC